MNRLLVNVRAVFSSLYCRMVSPRNFQANVVAVRTNFWIVAPPRGVFFTSSGWPTSFRIIYRDFVILSIAFCWDFVYVPRVADLE